MRFPFNSQSIALSKVNILVFRSGARSRDSNLDTGSGARVRVRLAIQSQDPCLRIERPNRSQAIGHNIYKEL
uniref:Uncharacterized protein n=1 Tax=Acrobeloides nanus TaxID=290746 RepID=A0A914DR05_9BILA